VLSPGVTDTRILWPDEDESERRARLDALATQMPAGRIANVEEVAEAALFLGSAASSYMLGGELRLDGGRTSL
jgi:NAD(P)-dependent dehydrogenase (short-subunit alcohol dehydrogenase family)